MTGQRSLGSRNPRDRDSLADAVRRRIAVLIAVFAIPATLALFSEAGPAPGAARVAAILIAMSTVPVAAAVWAARRSFTWWRRERAQAAVALIFTVYADVGTGAYILLLREPVLSLIGCALFAVISTFVAFFGGRLAVAMHVVLTTAVIVGVAARLFQNDEADPAAIVTGAACIWLAVNATMSLVSTTSWSLHRTLEMQVERAQTDPLTGLLNMRGLEVFTSRHLRGSVRLGFLLIDLDHFKRVNDLHGHLAGDAVLTLAAERLRAFVGNGGVSARRGGEEFLVIVDAERTDVAALAESIRTTLLDRDDPIPVTVSIGISEVHVFALDSATTAAVVNHGMHLADVAMYRAKAAGRNTVVRFDGEV